MLIAFVTSALTSAGAFFALRGWMARGAATPGDASAVTALRVPPPPAPPPVATEQLHAEDAEPAAATAADANAPAPAREPSTASAGAGDEVVVPQVSRKRLAAARSILARAGFKVTVSYSYDEDVSEGRILRQLPRAGTRAPRGSSVRLVVNQD